MRDNSGRNVARPGHATDHGTTQARTLSFTGPALPRLSWTDAQGDRYDAPVLTPRRISGDEAIGRLFEYRVEAVTAEADFFQNAHDAAQVDLNAVVGTLATVSIELKGKGTWQPGASGSAGRANFGAGTREISGLIASASILRADSRVVAYEFVLRPWPWLATLNRDSRIYRGSVTEFTDQVLDRYSYGVEWRIAGPWSGKPCYPPRDLIRQAWEDDWSLVCRLWEEWGLVFWFEHGGGTHKLVISDTPTGFHKHGPAYETLRYHADGGRIDEEHIDALAITSTITAGKATVNDHDYMAPKLRKANRPFREEYECRRDTPNATQEIYAPAEFAQPLTTRYKPDEGDGRMEGRHLARVKLEAARCAGLRAKGHGHLRGLEPGRTFTLTHYPQDKANREYLVLRCTLDISEVGVSSGAWREYSVDASFELQPSAEYYRMPQTTPRPRIHGYEYAVVVGPQEREMWIDSHNRALIQFDWDREGQYDGHSSIWVRLVMPWQGDRMGAAFHVRCGHQVMVSYINGDPDRPIITGSVADRFNEPVWDLPRNQALTGIRSRSLHYGRMFNHLVLDDTAGKQQAQLWSDHGASGLILGYNTRISGNEGRQDARGEGYELRTDKTGVHRAAGGMLLTTEGRPGAQGRMTDMPETVARLARSRDLQQQLGDIARRSGAQDAAGAQSDVAKAITKVNAELRGNATADANEFPEFDKPAADGDGNGRLLGGLCGRKPIHQSGNRKAVFFQLR